jgi:hypothetical protein
MTLLMCLAGWFAVSVPVTLFVGRLMRMCEQRERARRPHGLTGLSSASGRHEFR